MKKKLSLFSVILLSLMVVKLAYSSDFTTVGDTEVVVSQRIDAITDSIRLEPATAAGISYNDFSKFEVTGKKLVLFKSTVDDSSHTDPKLIVIKSPLIELYDEIELVGSTSDILFISPSTTKPIVCQGCSFKNFGRVMLAVANATEINDTASSIGNLATLSGGSIRVNNLNALGVLSLELLAESQSLDGIISTNLRAKKNPTEGYSVNESGNLVLGNGGVNLYIGALNVNYDKLEVSDSSNQNKLSSLQNINSRISSSSISVISSRPLSFSSSSVLSTKSDLLATNVHQDDFIAPVEGIFVQTNRDGHASVSLNGKLISDNKIQVSTLDNLEVLGSIDSYKLLFAAKDKIELTSGAKLKAKTIELSSDWMTNQGSLNGTDVFIETENNIYNHFGGRIIADYAILSSNNGIITNGSRTERVNTDSTVSLLNVNEQLTANDKYGAYYLSNQSVGSFKSDVSAKISANSIYLSAVAIENINPYHLSKPDGVSWANGVQVNAVKSQQVSIVAESNIEIESTEYLLNSSATIGQNQSGRFIINKPKLVNQRYRVAAELAIFSRLTYSDVNDGKSVEGQSSAEVSQTGIETYLSDYSPPGVIYSYSDFYFADGDSASTNDASFINQFSFLEVFGESHFHQTDFHSIGLVMAARESGSFEAIRCAAYGCSASTYNSLIEFETLTSFADNVYGINTSLAVTTVNQLEDGAKQAVIDAFIEQYKEDIAYDVTYENPSNIDALSIRNHHYLSAWEIVTTASGDKLRLTVNRCTTYNYRLTGLNSQCTTHVDEFSVQDLLENVARNAVVNGIIYTGAQIEEKIKSHLDKQSISGQLTHSDVPTVYGTYVKTYESWALTPNNESVVIRYVERFRPNSDLNLTMAQGYLVGGYQKPGNITVNLEELLNIITPPAPTNVRVISTAVSNGEATVSLAWDEVVGEHTYYVNGVKAQTNSTHIAVTNRIGNFTSNFNVIACNTVKCGEAGSVSVALSVPPSESLISQCDAAFYNPLIGSLRITPNANNKFGKYGSYCKIKTENNIKYYVIATRGEYYGGSSICYSIKVREREGVVSAIMESDMSLLPNASSLGDKYGQQCDDYLRSFRKLVK